MADEFTLLDYQQTATPITKAVVKTWREASPILEMLKFKTTKNLSEEVIRYQDLPNVGWRKIGEGFTQAKVTPTPVKERVYFMGAKIDIPREYVNAASIVDNRAVQSEAIMKGAAFNFNTAFFLNDDAGSVDIDAIVGVHHRIINDLASDQSFDANLDVSPDTAVTSWQHKFFDKIEDLLDRVDGNPGDKVLFCGRTMYQRLQSALRSANLLFTAELAGKQYMTYGQGGPKIVQAGYKYDQTTQILGDAESGTALTGGTDSSLYCVRFGEPYLSGFAQEMPNAEDKGETEDGVNVRTIVRFSPGIYFASPRTMALAYGFTAA
jgi:hypothetical protein